MYEVLGLFILFVVGIMLVADGGHLAHLKLFNNPITPMSKTTFILLYLSDCNRYSSIKISKEFIEN